MINIAHYCICSVCNQKFNRDIEQAVKSGARRYAHYSCLPTGELVPMQKKEEDPDLTKLKEYINSLYGEKANWALINRQIKKYTEENKYSLSGILKSMIYFYGVQKNLVDDKSNYALGIVPYCYQDAYNYYYNLFLIHSRNEAKDVVAYTSKVKEVVIPLPTVRDRKRIIDIEVNDE